jgi:hypothetical protein
VQTWDATMTNLDFWAIQVYRGHTFGSFFTDYASHSTKPLVFTEFGYDAFDARTSEEFENDAELPADAMEYLWNEIRMNRSVVSGGCVFEYADEWWKIFAANPSVHDTDGWSSGDRFVDGEGNEEWWGVFRILDNGSNPDLLEPRAMFFRLAGMWNDAYESSISEVHLTNGNFTAQFSHPAHLRDQHIELEMSTNLTDWIAAGGNYRTNTLTAYAPSVGFSGTETNDDMVVNFIHEPASTGTYDPPNLVHYGHFEPGTTMGWTTWCPAVNTFSRDGAYSLEFTGAGGWSVPQAFQTVPAKPGEEYHLSGYMYTPALLPADATSGFVKIVFRDEFGTDLPPASITIGGPSGDPNYPGAESRPALNASSPVHYWVYSEAQAVAPPNTVSVSFYALNLDQSAATMYFDSIEAAKVIQMPNDDDGAFFRVINSGL